jgi:hypothetical protein
VLGVACLVAAPLVAQQPTPAPTPRDTAAAPSDTNSQHLTPNTSLPDSLNPDSLSPLLPPLGPPAGPLPAARRYVFDRDALHWSGALTLGELIGLVPGVFVVRAGWYGSPEAVSYTGQGATSVELYWDGFALDPIGSDSAGFDTGRFDLGQFQRVEVEVLPTVLRVYLITDEQAARRPRTEVSFSSGDASTNAYRLRYLNRWKNGLGLNVGFAYFGTPGPSTSLGKVSQFQINLGGTWMVSALAGMVFQFSSYNLQRETLTPLGGGNPPIPGLDAHRDDQFIHLFAASRPDGMGLRGDAILGNTSFGDSSATLDASSGQASLTLSYRAERWSAETWARMRDTQNPFDVGARASWSPLRPVTLTSYARNRSLLGGGGQIELATAAELRLLRSVAVRADLRWRQAADAMFVASDSTETVLDWTAGVSLTGRLLSVDASYGRRGPFTAPTLGIFEAQLPGVMTVASNAVQLSWRLQPRKWLNLSGWLRAPSTDSVPFDPPTHSLTRLTFRSAFLPKFRRGIFDLMAQLELEAWGRGISGFDSTGTSVPLRGRSVINIYLGFRLVGAQLFWVMRNSQRDRYSILRGFELPRSLQRFGIRWEFTN